jgi:hypothetical protein
LIRNRQVRHALTLAALGVVSGACSRTAEPPAAWHEENGYRWRDLRVAPGGSAGFTKMGDRQTGIRFQNEVSDSALAGNRILGQGAGACLGDVDGDGRADVFLARTQGANALYRNLGGWRFQDITASSGVAAPDRYSTGCAFADVDGDADLDLVIVTTTGPNAVFLNDGKGRFTEHRDLGLDPAGKGATTIAMADVDGDGWLELFVANYRAFHVADSLPPQERTFNRLVRERSPGKYEVVPEHRRDYRVVMRPDMGGLRLTMRGAPDDFYANHRGRFTRVPLNGDRFRDMRGNPLAEEPESWGLGARFVDVNGDRAPDLYVTNDFEDTDELWLNDGRGAFRLADWTVQRQVSNAAMGVDVGDVNGDGLLDLFEVDMLSNDSHRLKTQIPTHTALPKVPGDLTTQLQQQRNALFVNRGDGTFAEVGMFAGVHASGWSWSTMFLDVDLDGWQDILIANGHLWDTMDGDVQERLQDHAGTGQWRRERWQFPPLQLKNVAFRNRGDLTFDDASEKWRFGLEDDISHAMAAADLDGDGDLDVVVNRLGAPVLLLRNDATAPRVTVRLIGEAPNTKAVGAKITLRGGAVPVQTRDVAVGGLYLSHSDYLASFAMGAAKRATLEIEWRDGRRTEMSVEPGRSYEVTEARTTDEGRRLPSPIPLFDDATPILHGHTHTEDAFDDWNRQFLLPNALSQLGPGVAWFDIDRDGDEDLIIGAAKGGRLSVFRNDNGRLVPETGSGPAAPADLTTIVGLSQNGQTRVIAGVSTWQARSLEERTGQPAAVSQRATEGRLASAFQPVVGSTESAVGPLALGDYDGDGDPDLFVGGRAIPMQYPVAATSGLFKNVNGSFVLDTLNSALLRRVGLVSGAVFSDLNGDGLPDLLLAREWESLLLLINNGRGGFARAPAAWGLDRWTSRWNGVATGDLDGDGRLDIVATSWGRNMMGRADSAHPLVLLHGPFGARGEEEMLLARDDPRVRGLAPLTSYARLRVAVPDVVNRVSSFSAYADATVETVLGSSISSAQRLQAVTLDNMAFLNRGDRFEAVPLPADAQLAPAFYAGIADFDGDGVEDVFLSQNFYPTAIGTPRYDTGRSLLLKGTGGGKLAPMTGEQSGLVVYGDQRGAAFGDYDRDARIDLVVSQNGAATRLFHNRGATPGLRVRVRGSPSNPDGVGVQIRLVYGDTMGPVREVQVGSGYWSQNGAVQVMGRGAVPTAVWVRWPGGGESRVPVPAGSREITVRR